MGKNVLPLGVVGSTKRNGLKDVWNAHMAEGASFGAYDIPFCPTTATEVPKDMITWDEAVTIHNKHMKGGEKEYRHEAFVCFYIDDYKFDGPRGIWYSCFSALEILRHFAGVITPDFSTYQDFPAAIKIHATYRMRVFGYWLGKNGIKVINNVRWGTPETWDYCYVGIPVDSVVAIGTVGGSPRKLLDRSRFEDGLYEMVRRLHPRAIIVYGSANYECFEAIRKMEINVISFQSKTTKAFERRRMR